MIVSHGSADEIFQSALIEFVALGEINRSPSISTQTVIEEFVRIWKACALIKGEFYLVLVSVAHADESIVRPTRRTHPFPFLDYLGVGIMHDFANISKHLAAPVR